ncbi:hypothetical protein TSUD_117970 [Trifolium subterraneum]|nr:hypothetical protein TSUD_117970 [Trifolium subterraneum]
MRENWRGSKSLYLYYTSGPGRRDALTLEEEYESSLIGVDVERDLIYIKDDLESIQDLIKDADRMAAEDYINEGVKTWVKQLREVSFRIEDVIDEYIMHEAQKINNHSIFLATLQIIIPGLNPLHKIASEKEVQGLSFNISRLKKVVNPEGLKLLEELVTTLEWIVISLKTLKLWGMGGLGKTTLANHVLMIRRELLTEMINKFCKDSNEPIPKGLQKMDHQTLITHMLQPLPPNKAWQLFCNKAFRGQCPTELEVMSNEIVQKCDGLPLAILAIGGLLSTKPKTVLEWKNVICNLRMELEEHNVLLNSLVKILSLSYDDLPYHLKSCMLYFGIYPEDYAINRKRLTRQWMAEGFVRYNENINLEEVAEEYLTELIHRNLVQVSRVGFDGKVKSCQVHNLLRAVIIRKMHDLRFCHLMCEDDDNLAVGITRRFSITSISKNVLRSTSISGIRAIFLFDKVELPKEFMFGLSAKFKFLKVLDFENSLLNYIPDNLGNLFDLRYLNLSHTKVTVLPKSIGMLVNLETLDLRQTRVHELPKEINKLTKLRLLPAYYRKYEGPYSMLNFTDGVKMKKGIRGLISLQKLYFLEADHGGIDLIQELEMLKQLRKLGIKRVRQEYGNALCAAIQEMKHLESLNIGAIAKDEILDLDLVSAPPHLRVLNLKCRLINLPKWIPNLKYLVKLRLGLSKFEDDPLDSLKNLPNLLRLNLWDDAFYGEKLHFKKGGVHKLKELDLTRLNRLSSVSIDKEALYGLEHFRFNNNPQLKVLPQDLKNLKNLQFLGFAEMPAELVSSIEEGGPCHGIINHIPLVLIRQNVGSKFHDYKLYRMRTQLNV